MKEKLVDFLASSYTAYQAVENAEALLKENGYTKLKEQEDWALSQKGKYYVVRGGSSIVAFRVDIKDRLYFKLVCSHTDSPCLKLKDAATMTTENYAKLNVETYGGGVWYSFFDRPMKIAGRIVTEEENGCLVAKNVVSDFCVTIPSLAVHMNRGVNDGFAVNPQVDLLPVVGLKGVDPLTAISKSPVLSYDLFVSPAEKPFFSGVNDEFLSSPRIDNLTSVYSSLLALLSSEGDGVTVACCFDNEEVGSGTLQGAGSDLLSSTLLRIAKALNVDENEYRKALAGSFSLSLDNAHAIHPNHTEKCDPTNHPLPGKGVVIKHHANKAYATDARSSALVKSIFAKSETAYQLFYNRSDMRSGTTLGGISLSQVGILTADIGLAQLAMHSAVECFAVNDFENLVKGLTAFYSAHVEIDENEIRWY